jgi:hypothetical protein
MRPMNNYSHLEMDSAYNDRPPAPLDVWNHRDYSTWRTVIWELIQDVVNPEVRSAFLASPPQYVVCDDLSWLNNIVCEVTGEEADTKALLAQRLRRRFRALRAVHGTRTADLGEFYRQGILPLVPAQFHLKAHEIFLGGEFPELSEEDLDTAIRAGGSNLREGRVYFEANEEMLIAFAGHYMLYGSEYLLAIAAHLGTSHRDYRRVLKRRGTPTLFVCEVPLELISERTLQEFAGDALESVFQELLDGPNFRRDRWRGAGFSIRCQLSPACIVGHYHPVITRDPFGM